MALYLIAGVKMDDKTLIVISGRSSSGKSTLVSEIEKRGYNVIREVAREVLNERKNYPENSNEFLLRQKIIYSRHKLLEDSFDKGIVFCDRSLIDIFGYCKYFGIDSSFIQENLITRYSYIFELPKRRFVKDNIRLEKDNHEADKIYNLIKENYFNFGYNFVNVPRFSGTKTESVNRAVEFILRLVKSQK